MEGGWLEQDEAAVSAREACCLHCANHLHTGKAASHPSKDHCTIPAALRGSWRELLPLGKFNEDRQTASSSTSASGACKSAKCAAGTLGTHFVISKWYMHTLSRLEADFVNAHNVQIMCTLGAGQPKSLVFLLHYGACLNASIELILWEVS